jgi:hypothetical protein
MAICFTLFCTKIQILKVFKRFLSVLVSSFTFFVNMSWSTFAIAQDPYAHWKAAVNWDGVTPWENYMVRSSGHMGPNALPVPISRYPRITDRWEVENAMEFHRAIGDQTNNLFHYVSIPMASERVSLALTYRAVEWYSMSPEVRDFRRARDASGSGSGEGDVWIASAFQLVRQDKSPNWPDLMLQVTVKTTAGKNFENARHTNSPGYIFDLHAGRTIEREGHLLHKVQFFGQAGLFVWQQGINSQNDAFNFAINMSLYAKNWTLTPAIAGYSGWIKNGDKPIVARLQLGRQLGDFNGFLGYQYAFRDLTTHMVRFGLNYQFTWSKWPA